MAEIGAVHTQNSFIWKGNVSYELQHANYFITHMLRPESIMLKYDDNYNYIHS